MKFIILVKESRWQPVIVLLSFVKIGGIVKHAAL